MVNTCALRLASLCFACVCAVSCGTPPPHVSTPHFSTPVTPEEVRQAYYAYSAPAVVQGLHERNAVN